MTSSRRGFLQVSSTIVGAGLLTPTVSQASDKSSLANSPENANTKNIGRLYDSSESSFEAYAEVVSPDHSSAIKKIGFEPMRIGRREGAKITDAYTGREMWDMHRNGSVYTLGHRHPEVVATAITALEDGLDCGNFLGVSDYRSRLVEQLVKSAGPGFQGAAITTTASQANEYAVSAARRLTNRRKVIAISGTSYAGGTGSVLQFADDSTAKSRRSHFGVSISDEVVFVKPNDLPAMKAAVDNETAAVLMETSQAQGAFPDPAPGYLEGVREICTRQGAQLIFDEVQTGLGTSGSFWSFQTYGVRPDIFVCGKGLGGGLHPIAAAVMAEPVWRSWTSGTLTQNPDTYAGSEFGCCIASKVLEITSRSEILDNAKMLQERFRAGLKSEKYRLSGSGTNIGMHLIDGSIEDGFHAARKIQDAGVFALASFDVPALILRSPIILSMDDADDVIHRISKAIL